MLPISRARFPVDARRRDPRAARALSDQRGGAGGGGRQRDQRTLADAAASGRSLSRSLRRARLCAALPAPGGGTTVCPARSARTTARETFGFGAMPWRRLMGFEGPYYATEVRGTGVHVMTASVGLTAADSWSVVGLVRNDTERIATDIIVTARLTRPDGGELASASAPVAVRNVRPGEPAPFAISTTAPLSAVGGVQWEVAVRPAGAAAAMSAHGRDLARPVDLALGPRGRPQPAASLLHGRTGRAAP